jgi:PAS domain S-box-containing protein
VPEIAKSRQLTVTHASETELGLTGNLHQSAFHASRDGIVFLDSAGAFLEVNATFARILAVPRETLIGRRLLEFVPSDNLSDAAAALTRLQVDPSAALEFPLFASDGRLIEFEWTSAASFPQILICRELSDRRKLEAQLHKVESRYRALAEASCQIVWTADRAGRRDDLSRSWWMEFTGQSLAASDGWGWVDAVHPSDRQRARQHWKDAIESRSFFKTEYRVRSRHGSYRHFSFCGVPIANSDGSFREWVGTITDVTAQRIAEGRAAASSAKLRAYFETASQGIVRVDESGRIEELNQKFLDLCGYTREELMGCELTILVPEEHRKTYARHIASFFRAPRMRPMGTGLELMARHKDGHDFPVEIGLSFVESPEGVRALAFVSDITERKRSEAALLENQKLESLGVLAGGIAHDFNNLLVGIMGNASLLQVSPQIEMQREIATEILKASHRAADLTRQLLAYAGKARFDMRPVDLSALVKEISTLVHASIPKTVYLRLDLDDNAHLIHADAGQIQQVIMNLVINGAEAIPANTPGVVVVTTAEIEIDEATARQNFGEGQLEPGKYISLEIQDTGDGMDEATRLRIFDPFFTTKFMGRGLGLSAVLGIVRAHQGALRVESRPGEGSSFHVVFPALSASPADLLHEDEEVDLHGEGLVLVVDDEPTIRRTAKMALERFGYQVLVARDGAIAVELFEDRAQEISLVIMDLTMPEMGGEEALRRLQIIRPDVRVIISSGYHETDVIQNFTGQKLAGFIQKPYTILTLAQKVKAALT